MSKFNVGVTHTLSLQRPTERLRAERSWTARCRCGWEESASTRGIVREEYRSHVVRSNAAEMGATVVTLDDQSKNGVRVLVRRSDGGSTVEADCACYGNPQRVHSSRLCPVFKEEK